MLANSPLQPDTGSDHGLRRRVLLVSGLQIYPTLSGGNLRSFALANALRRFGNDVFVYSFVGRKAEYIARQPSAIQSWPGGLQEYVDRGGAGFLAGYGSYWLGMPPLWLTAWLRATSRRPLRAMLPLGLRDRLKWCDVLVADFPFLYPIFEAAPDALHVLNTHNIEHHLYDAEGSLRDRTLRRAVRRVELSAARTADIVVSCCDADMRFFERETAVRHSLVVPNGIDLDRFEFSADVRSNARSSLGIPDNVRIFLFTASKYGPNAEAFDFLLAFARDNERILLDNRIHILVVGNVVADPVQLPTITATGKVDTVEPYFAAADAALNPLGSGAGTNVKMAEFIAARLPIVVSEFGARGFRIEDGRTGFLFERSNLAEVLLEVRRLLDVDPERLRTMTRDAYLRNAGTIDMNECVRPLAQALSQARL